VDVVVANIRRHLTSYENADETLEAVRLKIMAVPLSGLDFWRANVYAARGRKASGMIN